MFVKEYNINNKLMSNAITLPLTGAHELGMSQSSFSAFQKVHRTLETRPRKNVEAALNLQEDIFDEANTPEDLRIEFRRALGVSEWNKLLGAAKLIEREPLLGVDIASGALNIAHTSEKPEVSMRRVVEDILYSMYGLSSEEQVELREKVKAQKLHEEPHPIDLIFTELEHELGASETTTQKVKPQDAFPNLIAYFKTQIRSTPKSEKLNALKKAASALNAIAKDDSLRELFQAIDKTLSSSSSSIEKHIVTIMKLIADLDLTSGDKKIGLSFLKQKYPRIIDALVSVREEAEKTVDSKNMALRDFYDATLRRVEDTTRKTTREVVGRFNAESDEELKTGKLLLKKYNIDPKKVPLINASNCLTEGDLKEIEENKELFLVKLLNAHEHSLKNRKLKTSYFSNRQYSTSMQLELKNNSDVKSFWTLAGNFELNISELICGERGNMTIAVNKAIEMLGKDLVDKLPDEVNIENMLKVKRLAMSSSKVLGEDKSAWQPCSDCYSWMGTMRFFGLDTQILSLGSNDEKKLTLEVRTLADLLPKQGVQLISITSMLIENMPIEYSNEAKKITEEIKLNENMIREMLKAAKKEYGTGEKINEGFSGKESAAAVLFHESNRIFTGKRIEWVPRWTEPAALVTITKGINELSNAGIKQPIVKAIAHYGDHEDIPDIKTNGRIAQKRGSKDVIHIVIENDVIKVRTITDYQPFVHGSVRKLSDNRKTV